MDVFFTLNGHNFHVYVRGAEFNYYASRTIEYTSEECLPLSQVESDMFSSTELVQAAKMLLSSDCEHVDYIKARQYEGTMDR